MDDLVPENIERLIPYEPGKPLEELERELGVRDAIKLASNECPIGPSPRVVEAIAEAASQVSLYPDGACYALRRDLAAHLDVPMDEILVGNGSNEVIDLLCRTFASPDDHIVFGVPSFVCYMLGAHAANVPFTAVPLRDHLHWDVDALLSAVTASTKVLFVANPNNPTGTHLGEEALGRLVNELPPRVVLVIDEAYLEFADARDYRTALTMRAARERLVILRTFSKAYGLAGLRVGYAVAPREMVGFVNRVRAPFNVNAVAQIAARAALTDPEHVEEYVALNRRERARVTEGLRGLGLTVAPSQTNFVLTDFGRPGREVYDRLLRKGVIIRPMPAPIASWLRITIGTAAQNDRLLAAVREIVDA